MLDSIFTEFKIHNIFYFSLIEHQNKNKEFSIASMDTSKTKNNRKRIHFKSVRFLHCREKINVTMDSCKHYIGLYKLY